MLILQAATSALDTFPTWQGMLMCMAGVIGVSAAVSLYLTRNISGEVSGFIAAQTASALESARQQTAAALEAAFQRGEAKARMDALALKLDDVSDDLKAVLRHQMSKESP